MKKILLFTTLLTLPFEALSYGNYYFKVGVGGAYNRPSSADVINRKLSPSASPVGYVAIGMDINKYVRGELSIYSGLSITQKANGNTISQLNTLQTPAFQGQNLQSAQEKHKIRKQILLARLEQDIKDFGYGKFYTSFGVGVARITDRVRIATNTDTGSNSYSSKPQSQINPAYAIGCGLGFFLSNDVIIDISYTYLTAGKTKESYLSINNNKFEVSHIRVASHDITAGLRVIF